MRATASILHLDLDAFFASVEQRDKPSLRGKPVIVGGVGQRGVVSTASYEARAFGVHSAMPAHEARRLCPHAAFLAGRFGAYREASSIVLGLLRDLSPLVEPLSLDEAFVDLVAGPDAADRSLASSDLLDLAARLRADVTRLTGGLTASVGLGSSKFMAKVASELAKPDGVFLVEPGTEVETISGLPARAIPGVGPATMEKLARLGVATVADVQSLSERELVRELGKAMGQGLYALAFARDDRPVVAEREAKSISVEDTFEHDIRDREELARLVERDAALVAGRLAKAGLFAKTISVKVRLPDFTTFSRSQTLHGATDRAEVIGRHARDLLFALDLREGVRLLGVGVSGFTDVAQETLFELDAAGPVVEETRVPTPGTADPAAPTQLAASASGTPLVGADVKGPGWASTEGGVGAGVRLRDRGAFAPGADVVHDEFGPGWVWGSGLGRVTVRFETATTPPGPVKTFRLDDPALHPA